MFTDLAWFPFEGNGTNGACRLIRPARFDQVKPALGDGRRRVGTRRLQCRLGAAVSVAVLGAPVGVANIIEGVLAGAVYWFSTATGRPSLRSLLRAETPLTVAPRHNW
jgi:hypothetical protein